MARQMVRTLLVSRASLAMIGTFCLVACGNGGTIEFRPDSSTRVNKGAATTMVPASQALAVESAQTPATGYSGKLQINPTKGTVLTGGGYTVKLKHTVRNR